MVRALHGLLVLLMLATPLAAFANRHSIGIQIQDNIELELTFDTQPDLPTVTTLTVDSEPGVDAQSTTELGFSSKYDVGYQDGLDAHTGAFDWGFFTAASMIGLPLLTLYMILPFYWVAFTGSGLLLVGTIVAVIINPISIEPQPMSTLSTGGRQYELGYTAGFRRAEYEQRIVSVLAGATVGTLLIWALFETNPPLPRLN